MVCHSRDGNFEKKEENCARLLLGAAGCWPPPSFVTGGGTGAGNRALLSVDPLGLFNPSTRQIGHGDIGGDICGADLKLR